MPREVSPSHVKAARLRGSGVEWTVALKKAKVPDTDLARKSVCRIIRKLMSKAHAEAEAKAEAEREVAAADMQAKRKDLKARETALKLALREAAEDAAVAVKAVLTVARGQLRELKRKRDRVKQQGQGMSKKLKGAREAGRRVDELEREVVGLREDVASARAAAVLPVGREKELFNFTRDPSKRGAPFHPFFAEVIAPAMLTTGASGEQITEILRFSELRYFEPGKGPSEPPGPAWWQDQRHVGGGMSDAYAWYRIATAESATQGGCDETKINRLSRLNLWLARHDKDCEREVYNMGTCKVLIDGTAEGVRECVEIMFKRGQIIVIRLRSLLAAAGHNPDDYIPLVDARERKGGLWEEKNHSPPPGGSVKKKKATKKKKK